LIFGGFKNLEGLHFKKIKEIFVLRERKR